MNRCFHNSHHDGVEKRKGEEMRGANKTRLLWKVRRGKDQFGFRKITVYLTKGLGFLRCGAALDIHARFSKFLVVHS